MLTWRALLHALAGTVTLAHTRRGASAGCVTWLGEQCAAASRRATGQALPYSTLGAWALLWRGRALPGTPWTLQGNIGRWDEQQQG